MKIVIGHDKYGHELSEGDICKYKITDENGVTNSYKGMIEYGFIFNQLEADFPIVLMSKVNLGTIEKITNVYNLDNSFPDCAEWVEIFNERFNERLKIS